MFIPSLSNPPTKMRETQQNSSMEQQQEEKEPSSTNKKMKLGTMGLLQSHKVQDLVHRKRRLVEVPYTATISDTLNALLANAIVAVPVAAPPGRWIGAGGSMILESDPATGSVRKQYIGMVTMLDVLVHVAEVEDVSGLEKKMGVQVFEVIGRSTEGLSLWTLHPNTSILDCMETFSKGVHRALVPLESLSENVIAAELVEASPGYRMLTQMDVLAFLREHANELKDVISSSVGDLGAVNENIFAVTKYTKVIEAIKCMRTTSLSAVPIVEACRPPVDDQILQEGKGKRLVDTFSATDLREFSVAQLQALLSTNVVDFKRTVSTRANPMHDVTAEPGPLSKKLVTCYHETSLGDAIDEAVKAHVHRLWVVDHEGLLQGLVSLTDILRVLRDAVLCADRDAPEVVQNK